MAVRLQLGRKSCSKLLGFSIFGTGRIDTTPLCDRRGLGVEKKNRNKKDVGHRWRVKSYDFFRRVFS